MPKRFDDIERKFDDIWRATTPEVDASRAAPAPDIEIIEEPETFIITADVPGVEREDIRVDVSPQRVVITALVRGTLDALAGLFRRDRTFPGFERAISLPSEVRPDAAEAHYNNGVLEVVLPKRVVGGVGVYRLPAE